MKEFHSMLLMLVLILGYWTALIIPSEASSFSCMNGSTINCNGTGDSSNDVQQVLDNTSGGNYDGISHGVEESNCDVNTGDGDAGNDQLPSMPTSRQQLLVMTTVDVKAEARVSVAEAAEGLAVPVGRWRGRSN
ncbi:hypothetical protein FEM48_Zijuj07G0076500 [Ziziphus jujuba var. spinosa]|uniref:Uncharacterized protein n=1 Tax=Ziziphus jujuba var. spinosa TaxID=714518 RepID=A0A978V3C4_ZIZJJ|nr:hypothetical protein FEM48_Zijuj07G0076500 [Ziziphus jujuba var. spinosa]